MLVATTNGIRIEAWNAQKGPDYFCPQCNSPLILKKGRKVIHHFAHKPPIDCEWASSETRAHLEAKKIICESLRNRGFQCEVEFQFRTPRGQQRADVIAWSKDGKSCAVFEPQHSSISLESLETRSHGYAEAGCSQIWIPFIQEKYLLGATELPDGKLVYDEYPAKQFERWIHGFGAGNGMWVYAPHDNSFWHAEFKKYETYVEPTSWFAEGGEERSAGGYWKISKRYKRLFLSGPYNFDILALSVFRREAKSLAHYNWPAGQRLMLKPERT